MKWESGRSSIAQFPAEEAMKEQTREEPKIIAAAERQMQAWVRTAEIEGRAIRAEGPHRLAQRLGRYICISREEGTGGSQIAQLVGQELGWEVLDKNLLDRVAERFRCSRGMLELVDEKQGNWVYDVLGTWMDRKIITHDKYMAHLGRVLLAAVRHGNVVLVGRGAQFLLPREKGLAVRIIAPKKYRVEQIVQREGLSRADACRLMEARDRGRREFVRRYFHQDIDDPHLYDLVLNVERLGPAAAVQQIVAAIGR
jgi:hypothetical protein